MAESVGSASNELAVGSASTERTLPVSRKSEMRAQASMERQQDLCVTPFYEAVCWEWIGVPGCRRFAAWTTHREEPSPILDGQFVITHRVRGINVESAVGILHGPIR
nr:hypothetical protein [Haladaptatus halobius]